MSKDPGYAEAVQTMILPDAAKPSPSQIFNLHIEVLRLIGSEMERMHQLIRQESGDVDLSQEMLAELQQELIRLSQSLDEKDQ